MPSRKYNPSWFLPRLEKNSTSLVAVTEEVQEDMQEAVTSKMIHPPLPRRSTRLQRLTSYLPSLMTHSQNGAKLPKDTQPPGPAKLAKHADRQPPSRVPPPPPPRSSSTPRPDPTSRLQKADSPNRQHARTRNTSAEPRARPRASSLVPPMANENQQQQRVVSSPATSRPTSSNSGQEVPADTNEILADTNGKVRKKRSWLGGMSRSRDISQELHPDHLPHAWVDKDGQKMDYNLSFLTNAQEVPELWAGSGDTYIYLFPRETGRGPSFKIHSPALASSPQLHALTVEDTGRGRRRSFNGRRNLAIEDATRNLDLRGAGISPYSPTSLLDAQSASDGSNESIRSFADGVPVPREIHLYFPTGLTSNGPQFSQHDVQRLVDVRNLFAFLEGQHLLRTRAAPTPFHILVSISTLLKEFGFTNVDGSTYGEAATVAFNYLNEILKLGDVRHSREKNIEGIIIGEKMRSFELYNEAFAHAVGKYEAVKEVKPDLFCHISQNTRNRLERAFLDLQKRQTVTDVRLTDFDFPSLFAGIATSTSSDESKYVNFKHWRSHFLAFRKQVLSYYKDLHGQWPPKASSRKNLFTQGGLNRLVLKGLYVDFCSLYDLLADRESLTTRSYDTTGDEDAPSVDPISAALRRLLSEFDRSAPPVQPPIPFDIPCIPTIGTLDPNYYTMGPKEKNMLANRKLKDHEHLLILAKSHNLDADYKTPFLEMFKAFEEKTSRNLNSSQLADMRYGHWIFLYSVIQSLPMLVVDAPGLQYTQGVEYFLCEPSMGTLPWQEDAVIKREFYHIASSGGAVSLPSDLVLYGVEGIYRRSHCWTVAQTWIGATETGFVAESAEVEYPEALSPLSPPPGFAGGELGVRASARDVQRSSIGSADGLAPHSRGRSVQSQRNSIAIGLERLPIPMPPGSVSPILSPSLRGNSPGGFSIHDGTRRVSPSAHSSADGRRGSTFDDILGSISQDEGKGKGKKR